MVESMPTYYDVLRVERNAPPELIRRAYRRLAQKYHPDKMPGNVNAVRAMAAINAAYDVLSDSQRRAEHDRWIRRAERASRPAPLVVEMPPPETAWTYLNPVTGWPWYLLFGTMLLAAGTIVASIYLTSMPARATPSASAVVSSVPCKTGAPAATSSDCAPR
jgi:hypothetical protein